jgi:hypothetical protein
VADDRFLAAGRGGLVQLGRKVRLPTALRQLRAHVIVDGLTVGGGRRD